MTRKEYEDFVMYCDAIYSVLPKWLANLMPHEEVKDVAYTLVNQIVIISTWEAFKNLLIALMFIPYLCIASVFYKKRVRNIIIAQKVNKLIEEANK